MSVFTIALLFGAFGPALVTGVFAYRWRATLAHVWRFVGLSGMCLYFLMVVFVTSALGEVGMVGTSRGAPAPAIDPLLLRYLAFMLAWAVCSFAALCAARYLSSGPGHRQNSPHR
jgi:hypothetical protein